MKTVISVENLLPASTKQALLLKHNKAFKKALGNKLEMPFTEFQLYD